MTDDEDVPAVDVARIADRCTHAVRTARFELLDELVTGCGHRAGLASMWARLLVTLVPEEHAADLVDELWRRDDGSWLIAVEHFLDYAHRRDPLSLRRFSEEVASWPAEQLAPFARLVVAVIAAALPAGIVPSHYLVARGLIRQAAEAAGHPELTSPLAGLVALGWREDTGPARRLALDLARHVEQELAGVEVQRRAVAVLALVMGTARDAGEPIVVSVHGGDRVLTDGDDPAAEPGQAERATVVAARVVRHAGYADLRSVEAELLEYAPEGEDLIAVLLALALATAAQVREETPVAG